MKLTVLGSGTAAPRLDRNMSGYLLEIGKKKILLDSGPGSLRQLLQLDIDILDIDYMFFTHLHHDHIGDLGAYLWAYNYGNGRKKVLNLFGPKGFKRYLKVLISRILKPTELNFKINVNEICNASIKIKEHTSFIKFSSTRVKHIGECNAYRVDYKSKSLVYSGDLGMCKSIVKLAKETDLLILECAYPDKIKFRHHLTPSQCGEIAKKSKAKRLILTHFYPEADKVDIIRQCSKIYHGTIIKAKDLFSINV